MKRYSRATPMGMELVLCAMSAKRRAMLDEEPSLLRELLSARHEGKVPGLLDLDKTWEALDRVLSKKGKSVDPLMGDVILARTGVKSKARAGFGNARILEPKRVAEIAAALDKLEDLMSLVEDRYDELAGAHGGWGEHRAAKGDSKWLREKAKEGRATEVKTLVEMLDAVISLYAEAAQAEQSMLSIVF
jgi:hypothetical protein